MVSAVFHKPLAGTRAEAANAAEASASSTPMAPPKPPRAARVPVDLRDFWLVVLPPVLGLALLLAVWAVATAGANASLPTYMGVARVQAIVAALLAGGLPGTTPAAVVCSAHTPAQHQAVCTLGTLDTLVATLAAEGLASPAILVIGNVVQACPLWAAERLSAPTNRRRTGPAAIRRSR